MTESREVIIEAGRADADYWRDLWRFRELFRQLAWRDIAVRHKQTVFGFAWVVVRPILAASIFAFIFGRLAKLPTNGVPVLLFVFAGMLPWQFFATALSESSQSLLGNSNLISKIYFPRLLVPVSALANSLVEFAISGCFLAGLLIVFQWLPPRQVIFLPLFALMALAAALGTGLLLGALTVRYRDFRVVTPFLVQFGLFISPVGLGSHLLPDRWRLLYSLNPMVGVIDGFRWAALGGQNIMHWPAFAVSLASTLLLLLVGVTYFRRTEKTLVDVI